MKKKTYKDFVSMEDKEAASKKIVKNAIKYIKTEGWDSSSWGENGRPVCLMGGLLQGAGYKLGDEHSSCNIIQSKGKKCTLDEALFRDFPPLKQATEKSLAKFWNELLEKYADKLDGQDLGVVLTKLNKDIQKQAYQVDSVEELLIQVDLFDDELQTIQSSKDQEHRLSSLVQSFNDGILNDDEQAIKFLKNILKELNSNTQTVVAIDPAKPSKVLTIQPIEVKQEEYVWIAPKEEVVEEKQYVYVNERFNGIEIN